MKVAAGETRTLERIRAHYLVERELADRLKSSQRSERRDLYRSVYDELFRRVDDHPQLARAQGGDRQRDAVASQLALLRKFLTPETVFLEVGPGDCSLSIAVAAEVRRVFAVDVSDEITRRSTVPENLTVILSDGCSIPVPAGSIKVAYSYQLMEHLHPEDAADQLRNIHSALGAGGAYVCITPNRWSGPHDVSRYFDPVARGLHLKESTTTELSAMLRGVGFPPLRAIIGMRGNFTAIPTSWVAVVERALSLAPPRLAAATARNPLVSRWIGAQLAAFK